MSFLPSWYGLLCSLIVLNVLFETGVSGSSSISNPLAADDILKNHTFGNHHQCQRLCWYIELCERFSFYTKNLDDAHPHNCVLHAGEEKDDDLSDGWMQEKASGDYLPSEHGCRNRTCGKEKVCVPLAMPDVKNVCNDLPADVNECASSPCQNGTCVDGDRAYTCNCSAGYNGSHCETDIDECASSPCQNNGSCVNQVNAYTCNCRDGYNGSNCETDIDDCVSSPCKNNGSCVNQVNAYTCNCPAGYTGSNCETDVDECASDPCMNGATCQDQVNGYTCNCSPGYTGYNCEDVDECASDPCMNGATCQDQVNGYTCNCSPGYTGYNCKETWVNQTCTNNSSCNATANTACYSGQCLCANGLFFSHSMKSCVEACNFTSEDTYLHYAQWDMKDHNILALTDYTVTACASNCSNNLDCRVFVAKGNNCWLKKITAQDFPHDWIPDVHVSTYQRTCP